MGDGRLRRVADVIGQNVVTRSAGVHAGRRCDVSPQLSLLQNRMPSFRLSRRRLARLHDRRCRPLSSTELFPQKRPRLARRIPHLPARVDEPVLLDGPRVGRVFRGQAVVHFAVVERAIRIAVRERPHLLDVVVRGDVRAELAGSLVRGFEARGVVRGERLAHRDSRRCRIAGVDRDRGDGLDRQRDQRRVERQRRRRLRLVDVDRRHVRLRADARQRIVGGAEKYERKDDECGCSNEAHVTLPVISNR